MHHMHRPARLTRSEPLRGTKVPHRSMGRTGGGGTSALSSGLPGGHDLPAPNLADVCDRFVTVPMRSAAGFRDWAHGGPHTAGLSGEPRGTGAASLGQDEIEQWPGRGRPRTRIAKQGPDSSKFIVCCRSKLEARAIASPMH